MKKFYSLLVRTLINSVSQGNRTRLSGLTVFLFLAFLLYPMVNSARPIDSDNNEVSVSLTVQDIGTVELPSIINDQTIYLSASGIFNFLKIKNTASDSLDSLSGFFIHPDSTFLIDKVHNLVRYHKHIFTVNEGDIIVTKNNLYLRSDYFNLIFGLNCKFNFRNLSVLLTTKKELPVLREIKLGLMRQNLELLRGTQKTDTTLRREGKLFNAGVLDWSVYGIKTEGLATDLRATLGMGAIVAGGETTVLLNLHNQERINDREQYYSWRYVNNNNTGLRQVMLGKITGPSIASIFAPVLGAQVTNSPTTYRRAFDGYQYSGFTEPNWLVELYVNNELVDFKKADPAGFYTFNVPLVYGNSIIKLRFYGLFGEEKSKELNINIPFNFMPVKELEYTASAGIVEDSTHSKYSRFSMNYGLNSLMTIGGGMEYLSSVKSGAAMPFVNASARLAPGLLFNGEYAYSVRSKALLTYTLPSNLQIEAEYTHYVPGQKAINLNYLQEQKISFSMPYQFHPFSVYSRISFDRIDVPLSHYTNSNWLVTISGRYISANITTYALLYKGIAPYVFTNYSLTFRLPKGFMLTPQLQYEYRLKDLVSIRTDLEKRILRQGYINLRYERNFQTGYNNAMVSFRYEFGKGNISTNLSRSNGKFSVEQSAASSLVLQPGAPVIVSKNSNLGKGGVRFVCYLDLNGNGIRDAGEPKVAGLKIRVNGGQILYNKRDTSVVSYQMEPYTSYTVWLDQDDFQNIAWSTKIHSMTVFIEPDQIRMVEIPVSVKAEASGKVVSLVNGELTGQERMIVDIVNSDDRVVSKNMTEADGTFSYMGLKPGKYRVMVDAAQLKHLKLRSTPAAIPFTIEENIDGTYIDSLILTVRALPQSAVNKNASITVKKPQTSDELAEADDEVSMKVNPGFRVRQGVNSRTVSGQADHSAGRNKTGSTGVKSSEYDHANPFSLYSPDNAPEKPVLSNPFGKQPSELVIILKTPFVFHIAGDKEIKSAFVVQTVSFGNYQTALAAKARINHGLNKQVNILFQSGYYKLRISGIETRQEALFIRGKLNRLGYYGLILNRQEK